MDIEKIEKFIDAGYTKEEINAMLSESKPAEPEGTEHEKAAESGVETPPKDESVTNDMLKSLTESVAGLQETVKALQAQNVNAAKSASPKTGDKIKEAMDSFIATL